MDKAKLPPTPAWVRLAATIIRRLPAGRYRAINYICRQSIAPFICSLGITNNRMCFICDLRDGIACEACFAGYYEPQETALVLNLLRPGMCFVDVGANWGYFTLLGADLVGPSGQVVSFEPHPVLFSLLKANLTLNELAWVTRLQVAVADTDGTMNLAGFDETTTNWGISRLMERPNSNGSNFCVRTGLLERFLNDRNIAQVDLLKMDIEGAEVLVLPTMAEGLSRARYKHILLELHPTALEDRGILPQSIYNSLLRCGYRGWRVDHSAAGFRRAAYHLPACPAEFLVPLDLESPLDSWPHALFVAPNVEPSW